MVDAVLEIVDGIRAKSLGASDELTSSADDDDDNIIDETYLNVTTASKRDMRPRGVAELNHWTSSEVGEARNITKKS